MVVTGKATSIQVGPQMEIILMRGPLSGDWLHAIAKSYGSHDPKYSSEAFCRYQFNENAFGFSLHAFACADKEVVGHCAIIPVATRVAGATRMTGKTESLFVRKEYRKFLIPHGEEQQTLAVTIVRHLYEFAVAQGFSVIHSLGRPEFAKIHGAGGARVLEFQRRQFAFFLRPEAVPKLLGDTFAVDGANRILHRQRRRRHAIWKRVQRLNAQRREIGPHNLAELDLAAFTEVTVEDDRWTLAPTAETAQWYLGSPALRRMRASCEEEHFDFVYSAVGSGSWLEILDWRTHANSTLLALWTLCRIIEDAEKEGRELVCFFDWTAYNPSARVLQRAGKLLGFEVVEKPRLIYIRSEDKAFSSIEQMSFSPYFYATF